MSDITMCKGVKCPIKNTCRRYKDPINELMQFYLLKTPYDHIKKDCQMYLKMRNNEKNNK